MEIAVAFTAVKAIAGTLAPILSGMAGALTVLGSIVGVVGSGFNVILRIFSSIGKLGTVIGGVFTSISTYLGSTTTSLAVAGQSGMSFVGVIQSILGGLTTLSGVVAAVGVAFATVFVGGFTKWMATSDTFKEYLSSWGESIKRIATGVKDIFTVVFEALKDGINNVATRFSSAFESISAVVQNLLDVLAGVVDFVAGVLTGDWKRALKAWYDLWNAVLNTIGAVLNIAISAINNFVQHMVNKIFSAVNSIIGKIPDFVKSTLHIPSRLSTPQVTLIKPIQVAKVKPALFANGGVVTEPTRALIGEAGRSEAVIPLDNSPQMKQLVNQIAEAVKNSNDSRPIEVRVFLDSREITSAQNRANRMFGKTQMSI